MGRNLWFFLASDIVSRAHPMPSRRPFVNLIFKNRLPQFSSDLNDIWFECEQQCCPKSYGSWSLIFRFYFFSGSLVTKIGPNGNFRGFWPFSPNSFNMRQWNLIYRHIGNTFRCVRKMAPVGKIFGPFLVPNKSIYTFSSTFLNSFHLIHTKLDL